MRSNVDAPRLSSACESNPYSENHHIPVFLSWMTRQFIALIFNYRNSSSITQIIIINITIGTTIWRANNANINSISKIKKSVTNIQPTTHTSSDITTNVPKNDINTFIMFVFVVCYNIKYNKFYYGVSTVTDKESGCSPIAIELSDISFNCFSVELSLL